MKSFGFKNGGGCIKKIALLGAVASIFIGCSSSNKTDDLKSFYVAPIKYDSLKVNNTDLSSGSLRLTNQDIRAKKDLSVFRYYDSNQKDKNEYFGNFKINYQKIFNKKIDYKNEPIASNLYMSEQEACQNGFDDLKDKIYLGKLNGAQAIYNEKNRLCDIYEDGQIKASLIIKNKKTKNIVSKKVLLLDDLAKELLFIKQSDGSYLSINDKTLTLNEDDDYYILKRKNDNIEYYDKKSLKLSKIKIGPREINLEYKDDKLVSIKNSFNQTISLSYNDKGLIEKITDIDGLAIEYSYDENNNLISITYKDGSTKKFEYDSNGKLISLIDANGVKSLNITYSNGKVSGISKANGKEKKEFTYGNDVEVKELSGLVKKHSFKVINSALKVTTIDDGSATEQYFYNSDALLVKKIDKLGVATTYSYNQRGLVVEQINKAGLKDEQITQISYDKNFNKPIKVVKAGVATFYEYNKNGLLTKKIQGSVNPALKRLNKTFLKSLRVADTTQTKSTSYDYNDLGLPTATTLPNGAKNQTVYDDSGNPKELINPLGFKTAQEFDSAGRVTKKIDSNGVETTYKYDKAGRLLESNTNNKVTKYEYDKAGRLVKTTYPSGLETYSVYDENGNVIQSGDNQGNKTTNSYDDNNNLIKTVTYKDNDIIYSQESIYDSKNRLIKTIDALGNETTYTYNKKDQKISQTDSLGRVTRYEYDQTGNLVKEIRADGSVVEYVYNAKGLKTKVITPNGANFSFEYDNFDRATLKSNPDLGDTTYEYDISDNIIKETYANGNTKEYTYDKLNRVTSITYSNTQGEQEQTTYTYDEGEYAKGKLSLVQDSSGSTRFSYDRDGNIIKIEKTIDNQTFVR
jgi:YD repeat-containing protein